jgi:hypothetical protein
MVTKNQTATTVNTTPQEMDFGEVVGGTDLWVVMTVTFMHTMDYQRTTIRTNQRIIMLEGGLTQTMHQQTILEV